MKPRPASAKLRRLALLSVLVLLGGVVLAACGDSDNDSSNAAGGSSGGGAVKGQPIKVMSLAPVNSQTGAFPAVKYAAQAYEKWVNQNGGVAGRPLDMTFCDTQGTPAKLASCAQQAVRDKVVAVVGGFLLDSSSLVPVLKSAGIAWFGTPAVDAGEYTNDNVFPIGAQNAYQAGGGVLAAESGCKKMAVVVPDVPAVAVAKIAIGNGYKAGGGDPSALKWVKYSPTTTDYTTTAGQAAQGTDCIYAFIAGPLFSAWMGSLQSVGADQKIVTFQGGVFPDVAKKFSKRLDGALMTGAFADYHTDPAWADYREALAAIKAPSSLDYAGPQGQNTWTAFVAFTNLARDIEDLSAQSFLDAASKATNVDTGGLVKPLDFTQTSDFLGGKLARDFNRQTIFFEFKDGEPVADGSFRDMTSAIEGKQ